MDVFIIRCHDPIDNQIPFVPKQVNWSSISTSFIWIKTKHGIKLVDAIQTLKKTLNHQHSLANQLKH
jgi:hypothetical protein